MAIGPVVPGHVRGVQETTAVGVGRSIATKGWRKKYSKKHESPQNCTRCTTANPVCVCASTIGFTVAHTPVRRIFFPPRSSYVNVHVSKRAHLFIQGAHAAVNTGKHCSCTHMYRCVHTRVLISAAVTVTGRYTRGPRATRACGGGGARIVVLLYVVCIQKKKKTVPA